MNLEKIELIASIVVMCYLIIEAFKIIFKKKHHKYIPIIAGVLGGVLSVIMFILYKETFSTKNIFEVISLGIISGLASTGTNQILKQLLKEKGE